MQPELLIELIGITNELQPIIEFEHDKYVVHEFLGMTMNEAVTDYSDQYNRLIEILNELNK